MEGVIQFFFIENLRIKDLKSIFKLWKIKTEKLFIFSKDQNMEYFSEMLYERPTPRDKTFFFKDVYNLSIETKLKIDGYKFIKLHNYTQEKLFSYDQNNLIYKSLHKKKDQLSILTTILTKIYKL